MGPGGDSGWTGLEASSRRVRTACDPHEPAGAGRGAPGTDWRQLARRLPAPEQPEAGSPPSPLLLSTLPVAYSFTFKLFNTPLIFGSRRM